MSPKFHRCSSLTSCLFARDNQINDDFIFPVVTTALSIAFSLKEWFYYTSPFLRHPCFPRFRIKIIWLGNALLNTFTGMPSRPTRLFTHHHLHKCLPILLLNPPYLLIHHLRIIHPSITFFTEPFATFSHLSHSSKSSRYFTHPHNIL